MKVKINKPKIKAALRRAIKVRNESDLKGVIENSEFVKTEDTSDALLNENYYFNMDIGSFGITIDEIMDENFSRIFFESRLKAIVKEYDGNIRTKCDYSDPNFQQNFKEKQLDLMMMNSKISWKPVKNGFCHGSPRPGSWIRKSWNSMSTSWPPFITTTGISRPR